MISHSFTALVFALTTVIGLTNAKTIVAKAIVAGYYNGANASALSVNDIPSKYTMIMYSGATQKDASPTTAFQVPDEKNMQSLIATLRDPKRAAKANVLISFGGYLGSRSFSDQMATDDSRTKFAASMVSFMTANSFDGIEVVWVNYPTDSCYKKKPEDTANFLALLQKLRASIGQGKLLAAGLPGAGLRGPHDEIVTDLSEFVKVLDYVTLYDFRFLGPGFYIPNIAGPIAPLWDHCMPGAVKMSVSSSVKSWKAAGFPVEKILIGLTTYGFTYTLSQGPTYTNPIENGISHPTFSIQSATSPPKVAGDCSLNDITTATVTNQQIAQLNGTSFYDDCAEAPILINDKTKQFVTYENAQSYSAKGRFARANGLAGINVIDINGDAGHVLLDGAILRLCESLSKDDHPC